MNSKNDNILTVEELPVYTSKLSEPECCPAQRKPVFGEEYFRKIRLATNNFFGLTQVNLSTFSKSLEPVREVATSVKEDFIRKENDLFPKVSAITLGGMAGFIFGRKKGIIKKYFYSFGALLTMTAFCYPNETINFLRTGFEHSKMTWEEFKKAPEPEKK